MNFQVGGGPEWAEVSSFPLLLVVMFSQILVCKAVYLPEFPCWFQVESCAILTIVCSPFISFLLHHCMVQNSPF